MFHLIENKGQLLLNCDQEKVFSGISVTVNLENNKNVKLYFKNISKSEGQDHLGYFIQYSAEFENTEGNVTVELLFNNYQSFITLFTNAKVGSDDLFKKQNYFAAEKAIYITIHELMDNYELMANYQHKDWWTRPYFGENIQELPERTLSLFLKSNHQYYQLLPVSNTITRADLAGSTDGIELAVSPFHGGLNKLSQFILILGTGDNPYEIANHNVEIALKVCGNGVKPRKEKKYPEILDYLGWCTWDAFYHEVNEKGIIEKAEELKEKNIPVKWIMIDDGWSEVEDKKLKSFHADPEKFPDGLAKTASLLKQTYGVNWVGVWHTLAGYWEGINSQSEIAKIYGQNLYQTKNGSLIPYPQTDKGFGFWHAWHSSLKKEGVDFVKVDSQSAINNFMDRNEPVGKVAEGAHNALEASTSLHFNNTVINCMGMAQENIWHRPYSSVSRNSDDFVPSEKDSFKEHALQNAYNSLFHGTFYWGDWDMYWTNNHDDKQNMVLRAVSGGPIYFSDKVGNTNAELIFPLIYRDGKIIRCDQPGLPTEDSLFNDPINTKSLLKIWNTSKGIGVVAAFNINKDNLPISGKIGPRDIPNLAGEKLLVYEVFTKQFQVIHKDETTPIVLGKNEVSLTLIFPIQDVITPIGLVNKLISNDSILQMWKKNNGLSVLLKEGGLFSFRSEFNEITVTANGIELKVIKDTQNDEIYTVDCGDICDNVLVDIQVKR